MIRVAVIHPSFGRPKLAFECMREWMRKCNNPFGVEYFLALDDNDPSLMEYMHGCQANIFGKFTIDVGNSRTGIQAMNRAVKQISPTTELIVVSADDMGCPKFWDAELLDVLSKFTQDNFKEPIYIMVSDGMTPTDEGDGPKYALMNRAFYERVGFLQCPEYNSMYADNDLYECAIRLNAVHRVPDLVFEHRHHSRGLTPWDDTYWRTNNLEALEQGRKVFEDRKRRNFDL